MEHSSFSHFLNQTWQGEDENLITKISRFRNGIRWWNKHMFGNIF